MTDEIRFDSVEDAGARDPELLLDLCRRVFPDFSDDYLTARLGVIVDPHICRAWLESRLIGFKLGYRRGSRLFYSWLGGVDPVARGRGIARQLMSVQHAFALDRGFEVVETRTRAANNTMIILNLKSGFHVTGFEVDASGMAIVTQRKLLVSKRS